MLVWGSEECLRQGQAAFDLRALLEVGRTETRGCSLLAVAVPDEVLAMALVPVFAAVAVYQVVAQIAAAVALMNSLLLVAVP